jgi:hypothetical protein
MDARFEMIKNSRLSGYKKIEGVNHKDGAPSKRTKLGTDLNAGFEKKVDQNSIVDVCRPSRRHVLVLIGRSTVVAYAGGCPRFQA